MMHAQPQHRPAPVELAPGLVVSATLGSRDLSAAICALLSRGPMQTPELYKALGCTPTKLLYYLEPLVWKHKLVTVEKVPFGRKGARVCAWTLRAPLDDALAQLAQDSRPTPKLAPSTKPELPAEAELTQQAPEPEQPLTQQAQEPTQQATESVISPTDPKPRGRAAPSRLNQGRQEMLAQRRVQVGQAVRELLQAGPMQINRLSEALGRAGIYANPNTLRDRFVARDATLEGVRYIAQAGAYSLAYLPQHEAQARLEAERLLANQGRWGRQGGHAKASRAALQPAPKSEPKSTAPAPTPDPHAPAPSSASLDPRREPPLVLPGASPLSPVAARAAAERLAKRATIHGLTWTYRPVHGLRGIWEIVESQRQEDHRLMGEDICERRLQRWAREGFCPPRIDAPSSTNLQPQEVTP